MTTNVITLTANTREQRLIKARKLKEVEHLDETYGQLISNLKQYRLKAQLSLEALSRKAYVSKNLLIRCEQATYTNPPPGMCNYWWRALNNVSMLEIEDGYIEYQHEQRGRHPLFFGGDLAFDLHSAVHPFRQLRKQHVSYLDGLVLPVGVDEVSRSLCLPVDTLRFWEKKFRQQQSVPKSVKLVLNEIGYPMFEIREFAAAYADWRKRNLRTVTHD